MQNKNEVILSEKKSLSFNLLEDEDLEQAEFIFSAIRAYVKRNLTEKIDYGTIPYCGNKPVLFKPGAEKLLRLFKLRPTFEIVDCIVDYEKPLFHYHYRCSLYRFGDLAGQGDGLANSKEKKFSRNNNTFDYSVVNTVMKIGQKRALIAGVLMVCGASEYFTQDLEDQ